MAPTISEMHVLGVEPIPAQSYDDFVSEHRTENGWAKSTRFAEIYDAAGLVKKQDGTKPLAVESAQGSTLINFFQVVLILASWMPFVPADLCQKSCEKIRKSLASGASKWPKRLARRFGESLAYDRFKADDEDILFAYVLHTQRTFVKRIAGEAFMKRKKVDEATLEAFLLSKTPQKPAKKKQPQATAAKPVKKLRGGKDIVKALSAASVLEQKGSCVRLEKLVSEEWGGVGGDFFVAYGRYGKQDEYGAGLLYCPSARTNINKGAFLPAYKVEDFFAAYRHNPASTTLEGSRRFRYRAEVRGNYVWVENEFTGQDGAKRWGAQGRFRMSMQTFGMLLYAFDKKRDVVDNAIAALGRSEGVTTVPAGKKRRLVKDELPWSSSATAPGGFIDLVSPDAGNARKKRKGVVKKEAPLFSSSAAPAEVIHLPSPDAGRKKSTSLIVLSDGASAGTFHPNYVEEVVLSDFM